jgi:hyaluronan synthase
MAVVHLQPVIVVLAFYGALALSHIGLQVVLAVLHQMRFTRSLRGHDLAPADGPWPKASVIVPAYNEPAHELRACLESLLAQDYPGLEVICVDDGSSRKSVNLLELYTNMRERGMTIVMLRDNVGKRRAQMIGLWAATGEVIVTVDSDTTLVDTAAVRKLVRGLDDERVGAVTGCVHAKNYRTNLLTRLIGLRYWTAFNQERAAQSLFGVVMCCSGPFAAYRRSFLDAVREDYISQRFMGTECTFGDDRHLTNLALRAGHEVKFVPDAEALTVVPARVRQYWKQQVRWSKSFYREMLWTIANVRLRKPYLWYDLTAQALLPPLLLAALVVLIFQALGAPEDLVRYVLITVGIGFLRTIYGLVRLRQPGFILFIVFGFFYIALMTPCRLYALATFRRVGWGTR